jgi:hypothetical protein
LLILPFCLRPVSEADAEGLGTTIFYNKKLHLVQYF